MIPCMDHHSLQSTGWSSANNYYLNMAIVAFNSNGEVIMFAINRAPAINIVYKVKKIAFIVTCIYTVNTKKCIGHKRWWK